MKLSKNKKGFTLIELLATIAILAIVVSITLYVSLNAIEKAKEKSYKVTINNIQKEAANYLLENSDRLFFISYGEDVDDLEKNIEYQCITVQNLIDMGYFDEDIIESKIAKDTNVNTNMYVYIERDKTTKTVNKTILASIDKNNEIPEGIVCSQAVKAKGDISFVVEPLGWSREKKITLYYSLNNLNDVTTIGNYKYDYEYDGTSENIYDNGTEKQIKVTTNGTLEGYITLETSGDIANKKLEIDNIDNIGPVIELGNVSQGYVSKTVAIPLKVSDADSGVNYSSFEKSDIEVKVGGNVISDISLSGDGKGNFNLIINNDKYSGEVVITIAKNSVYDKVVDEVKNGNNETVLKPDVKFDNIPPTKPNINNPTNENWTNSGFPLSVSTIEEGSGVDYWQYTYAENPSGSGDHNTSWITYSNSSKNEFQTPNFTAERNQPVYVRTCDKVGNCSEVSNTYIRIDKTLPTITLGSNSDSTYTKTKSVTVTIKDASSGLASGASLKYGWSTSATTEPSSYTTVNPSYTAGTTSGVTFTASGSGLTGSYYLWVVPVTLKDVAGNSNTTTVKSTGTFKFDNTKPTITLSANSDSTYTKTKTVTVTIKDTTSGLASGASLKYGWSTSTTTEPSSYTTVSPSYTAGTTSGVTFIASGSGLTGSYYLWVKPVSLSDVAENSNTTTVKSTGTFKFDNTAPTKPDINNPTNENWTNSGFSLSVSTIEEGSGVDYWQYTYAENPSGSGDHNTSWVTYSNSSKNEFQTPNFTAERNQPVYVRVCDKVGNCSEVANTYIRIDKTLPTITLGSNSDSTYTKTKSVTVTIKDASSGLASGASLKYGWSTSATTEPSSYTTVNPSYTAGTTSGVTFTASGSGLTGSYYLWVVPVTLKDVAGNSNTTTVKSTGTFKFDNTAPTCKLKVDSNSVSFSSKSDDATSFGLIKSSTVTYNSVNSVSIATGTYNGYVKDAAGNTGSCSVTITNTSVKYTKTTQTCSITSRTCRIAANKSCPSGYTLGSSNCYKNYYLCGCCDVNYCVKVVTTTTSSSYSGCFSACLNMGYDTYSTTLKTSYSDYSYTCSSGTLSGAYCYLYNQTTCSSSWSVYSNNYGFVSSSSTNNTSCSVTSSFTCNSTNNGQSYVSDCTPTSYTCSSDYTKLNNSYCYKLG